MNTQYEYSVALKITGHFENKKTYSFLLTGDDTKRSLNAIINNYYMENDIIDKKEKEKIYNKAIKDLFSDVICYINSDNGSIKRNSYVWSNYILNHSKYPTINIISSDPNLNDG